MTRNQNSIDIPLANRILRDVYLDRKSKNGKYSTRAFARDISLSHAYTCLMLTGKRPVSMKQAARLAVLLKLRSTTADQFMRTIQQATFSSSDVLAVQRIPSSRFIDLEIDQFKVIQQWYHVAILDMTTLKTFRPEVTWVAKQLGIAGLQVRDAVARLQRLGLLKVSGKTWIKTKDSIYFPTTKSDAAVRDFHAQMIERAQSSLKRSDAGAFEKREISGITMGIRADRLPEAKKRIRKFQKDLAEYLIEGEATALYQLNVQFFPLTEE